MEAGNPEPSHRVPAELRSLPEPHARKVHEVLAALSVERGGLRAKEAAIRLQSYGPNLLPQARRRNPVIRFLAHFHNLLIYVLLGAAVITAGLGHVIDTAVILAVVFLFYVFFGSSEVVPDQIRWAGASLRKAMSHMWITSEGVFGIALGVSTKFVFLFVLFGALLDKAGAGNYFIKMAFGALGHLRGGPAKAAVVGSAPFRRVAGWSDRK